VCEREREREGVCAYIFLFLVAVHEGVGSDQLIGFVGQQIRGTRLSLPVIVEIVHSHVILWKENERGEYEREREREQKKAWVRERKKRKDS
jgi:hypothetical protein